MNAEEKAKDLIVKLMEITPDYVIEHNKVAFELCKQHALIAVDEIMQNIERNTLKGVKHPIYIYYQKVKKELEAMK